MDPAHIHHIRHLLSLMDGQEFVKVQSPGLYTFTFTENQVQINDLMLQSWCFSCTEFHPELVCFTCSSFYTGFWPEVILQNYPNENKIIIQCFCSCLIFLYVKDNNGLTLTAAAAIVPSLCRLSDSHCVSTRVCSDGFIHLLSLSQWGASSQRAHSSELTDVSDWLGDCLLLVAHGCFTL